VPLNREKFNSLVHYICSRTEPSKLGAVKLYKILWLSDFTAFHNHGSSITGARYIKRQFGPVPAAIATAISDLEASNSIFVSRVPFHKHIKEQYRSLSRPAMGSFSDAQIELIDRMIQFVSDEHTARSISEYSHDHVWRAAGDGEEIPYFTVFAVREDPDAADLDWARKEIESLG
jgi:Protein of unknown function (DUF4065)